MGKGCTWRSATFIPGFQAYDDGSIGEGCFSTLPGFGARPYRDFEHGSNMGLSYDGTGIPGTPSPGSGAQDYRETRHASAGNGDTFLRPRTGIPGMDWGRNMGCSLTFSSSNSVPNNFCKNTSTQAMSSFDGRR